MGNITFTTTPVVPPVTEVKEITSTPDVDLCCKLKKELTCEYRKFWFEVSPQMNMSTDSLSMINQMIGCRGGLIYSSALCGFNAEMVNCMFSNAAFSNATQMRNLFVNYIYMMERWSTILMDRMFQKWSYILQNRTTNFAMDEATLESQWNEILECSTSQLESEVTNRVLKVNLDSQDQMMWSVLKVGSMPPMRY